jgi:hypothetical protein
MVITAQLKTTTRGRVLAEISPRPFHFRRKATAARIPSLAQARPRRSESAAAKLAQPKEKRPCD